MNKNIRLIESPRPIGYLSIGGSYGLRYPLFKRPRWSTRLMWKLLLEWEYQDAP